jgi:hypothetical protein
MILSMDANAFETAVVKAVSANGDGTVAEAIDIPKEAVPPLYGVCFS